MRLGRARTAPARVERGTAAAKFPHEVLPLVEELSAGGAQAPCTAGRAEFAPIEGVAARRGLGGDAAQVRVDRGARRRLAAEARQLRMMTIAPGRAAQHGARE